MSWFGGNKNEDKRGPDPNNAIEIPATQKHMPGSKKLPKVRRDKKGKWVPIEEGEVLLFDDWGDGMRQSGYNASEEGWSVIN